MTMIKIFASYAHGTASSFTMGVLKNTAETRMPKLADRERKTVDYIILARGS